MIIEKTEKNAKFSRQQGNQLSKLHNASFQGITSQEDYDRELNLIVEKRSKRPYRQRMYLLWFKAQEIKSKEEPVVINSPLYSPPNTM